MSQFMQSIVQEVLSRNKTLVTPERKELDQKMIQPLPARNLHHLEEIHRPNYQRQKQQERIKVENSASLQRSQTPMVERQAKETVKQPIEDPISTLQRLTTSQILLGKSTPQSYGGGKGTQLIGKTKNSQLVWCFYSPDSRLEAIPKGCSSGFVTGVIENPGTVFIVEEWMKQRTDVKWEWFGEKNSVGWADTIKISSIDSQGLEQVLKGLYSQLNRLAIRSIKSYYVEKPSDYLWESLPFAKGQSVSALVGVSSISSMALLDRYFHHHPQVSFQFSVRDNHVILSGDSCIIQGVIQQLEDDAGQLLY